MYVVNAVKGKAKKKKKHIQIDLGTGLVGLEHLCRVDVSEWHAAMLDHVFQEGNVAVTQCDGREFFVQLV